MCNLRKGEKRDENNKKNLKETICKLRCKAKTIKADKSFTNKIGGF